MGTALPNIRGTSTALYPFTQTFIAQTGISDSQGAKATRWVKGLPLVRFEFPYNPITRAQKDTQKAAFTSAKGQFTTNLTAAFGGTTYTNLSFDADEFAAAERVTTQYGVRWALTQTLPQGFSPGSSGGAYPTVASGAIGQLPYTQKKRFQTIVSKMPSGPKYTYAEFGGGVTGFPTDGLMALELAEPALSDADVAAKVAHWLANWGNAFPFSFTDEDGSTYSNVYYASPQLVIQYRDINQSSITTQLVQMG